MLLKEGLGLAIIVVLHAFCKRV